MKKFRKKVIPPALSLMGMGLICCKKVETRSQEQSFYVRLISNQLDGLEMLVYQGSGQYKKIVSTNKLDYKINIPSMRGGYSSTLFLKFDEHKPEEFKVVQIKNKNEVLLELSINDIKALPKNDTGNYLIDIKKLIAKNKNDL